MEGLQQQMHEGAVGGARYQQPIERYAERAAETPRFAGRRGHEDRQGEDRVGAERARDGERGGIVRGTEGLGEDAGRKRRQPQDRIGDRRDHRAADEELEGEEAAPSGACDQAGGIAAVHQPGLHVALEPARALLHPARQRRRRLLEGRRVQHRDAKARTRQPDAEIGVLGDVERIPGPGIAQHPGAEMIGGAAKRDRHAEPRQSGQQRAEPQAVVGLGLRGQPVGLVVERQTRLQAGDIRRRGAELRGRLAQLARLGAVLRIEDDEEFAAREREREIERLAPRGLFDGPGFAAESLKEARCPSDRDWAGRAPPLSPGDPGPDPEGGR